MARRAGKAANRRSRQRSIQRTASRPAPAPAATPVPPVGTPVAREAIALDPPRRTSPPIAARAGSTLSSTERAEYHYVERDLRNIGVLTAVLAVLLTLAWAAFTALGLTG